MKVAEVEVDARNNNQEKLSWIVIFLLVALIAFNVILYVKLWKLDEHQGVVDDMAPSRFEFLR